MKGSKLVKLALALVLSGILCAAASAVMAADAPVLSNEDCVKCHEGPPADIAKAGAKHKTDVSCTDCHGGHRPSSKDNIPACSDCHDGEEHYKLKGCADCHKNPHTPLTILLKNNLTEPCLSCHKPQIVQLKENKSKHTALACTYCHTVHREKPDCVKCHKPHSAEMVAADCAKCHKAHMPAAVAYGKAVVNKDCGSCHKRALEHLTATATKHKDVACITCHKDKHKAIAPCQECHGSPHPANMMAKFPKCGDCHSVAHDLNNFAAQAPKPGAKPAAAPKPATLVPPAPKP